VVYGTRHISDPELIAYGVNIEKWARRIAADYRVVMVEPHPANGTPVTIVMRAEREQLTHNVVPEQLLIASARPDRILELVTVIEPVTQRS
jgi:hypothetical protein